MKSVWRQEPEASSAKAVSLFIFLALSSTWRAVAALAPGSCPIPLEKGTQWAYQGIVEWTVSGSAKVKTAKVQWTSEVMDFFRGSKAQAAVVRGFPGELAWYEPGQSAGFCVLLNVSNRVYRFRADGENQARSLARQLSENPRKLPGSAEEFLVWPLTVGLKWGQDPAREDTWYSWCVEQAEAKALSVRGFASTRPPKTYRLAYRTCPDHQFLDVTRGLGIVRYVYSHHGTVASADVHLISFSTPGAPKAQRRPPT